MEIKETGRIVCERGLGLTKEGGGKKNFSRVLVPGHRQAYLWDPFCHNLLLVEVGPGVPKTSYRALMEPPIFCSDSSSRGSSQGSENDG